MLDVCIICEGLVDIDCWEREKHGEILCTNCMGLDVYAGLTLVGRPERLVEAKSMFEKMDTQASG